MPSTGPKGTFWSPREPTWIIRLIWICCWGPKQNILGDILWKLQIQSSTEECLCKKKCWCNWNIKWFCNSRNSRGKKHNIGFLFNVLEPLLLLGNLDRFDEAILQPVWGLVRDKNCKDNTKTGYKWENSLSVYRFYMKTLMLTCYRGCIQVLQIHIWIHDKPH